MQAATILSISRADAGARLDAFLAARLGLSRRYAQRLIARDHVRVDGRPARKGTSLHEGARVEVLPYRTPSEGPRPEPGIEIPVLREEAGLLAVDKPAGLPTHPLDLEEIGSVLNALLARHPTLLGIGEGGARSGVVHRLDTGTSGVLVLASDEAAWRRARAAFAERRVAKRYLARVHGAFTREQELCLRLEHRGQRMRVVASGGREALTRLRPLEVGQRSTLIEARPVTGLMHQIRVTLAELGHPVVGDPLYGSPEPLPRHLLHAAEIDIEGFRACSPAPACVLEET